MADSVVVTCAACGHAAVCGPTAILDWLRRERRVRGDVEHDPEVLTELFHASSASLCCPQCGAAGLAVRPAVVENDESWGMARACAACGGPIGQDRLEALPDATLCLACQGSDERGESADAPEYCPRCGSVMTVRQTRTPGVTRCVVACPQCGRKP